jgi:dihydrofolate synthase / folylpolyglutamate synthase
MTGTPIRTVDDRAAFDALLTSATNYERLPAFHAGRVRVDLERMREYVARLGHPERASPVVHVTGTKGKGSTAALVARVLSSVAGRTGLHTSPHLHRMEERVLVDFAPIEERALLEATNRVLAATHADPPLEFPTYFELMTLVSFLHFAASRCAFAVHEVGMGGALDATNVVVPAVTAITNVALEHTAVLGDTVAKIAKEKAGIVKSGADVVTAAEGDALPPILDAARRAGVAVRRLGVDLRVVARTDVERGQRVSVATWNGEYRDVEIGLLGAHQAANLALALGIVESLRERGLVTASRAAIGAALRGFSIPCRLEIVAEAPCVVVDGAHTPESLAAAIASVRVIPARRIVVLYGTARDKDVAGAARALAAASHVVLTPYGNDRRVEPEELAVTFRAAAAHTTIAKSVAEGLDLARKLADRDGLVLVAGSLYLAAEVRAACVGDDAPLFTRRDSQL